MKEVFSKTVLTVAVSLLLFNYLQRQQKTSLSLGVESVGKATASLLFSQNFEGSDPLSSFHSLELG
ncbi:hypothetical protein, partial [Pontibacter virosus]